MSESCRKASFWQRSARQTTKAPPVSAALTIMSLRLLRFFSAALSSEERLENLVLRLKFSLLMSPPSTPSWLRLADGRTLLPEFSLANMLSYFVTRKEWNGNIAGDFKHINSHSYPLFKAGHVQRIQVLKGNDNNMYLSAVCLPEMRKDREYKIQVVLSPVGEIFGIINATDSLIHGYKTLLY